MKRSMTRRTFLKGAAASGAAVVVLRAGESARGYGANQKLGVALVGVGGRGKWFVDTIPGMENVVAMCDVNAERAAEAFKKLPDVPKFHDFRKMLDDMGRRIDAVITATPDHTHAVITMTAMKQGKHVYTEKPLTHDLAEARALREAAAKCKVATQMGNQGTAAPPFRQAYDIVQAGILGEIREVHAWNTGGGSGPRPLPPKDPVPVPETLQWDLWLGPVAARPFHPEWLKWHGWRDFATGQLGNWASHTMNLAFKALRFDTLWQAGAAAGGKGPTVRLEAEVSSVCRDTFPKWEIIRYDLPARGDMPPARLTWYNGGGQAPQCRDMVEKIIGRKLDWGDAGEKKYADHAGCLLVGGKGAMHLTGHNATFTLLPEEKFKGLEMPAPVLPRARGHEREWFDACRGGPPALSNFDYAGPLAEFVLLGNIATQMPGKLEFDPQALKFVGNADADKLLRRECRQGWAL